MRPTSTLRKPAPGRLEPGVVDFHLKQAETRSSGGLTPRGIIRAIEAGLPVAELASLQACLGIPLERLATLLGISKATLHRRKSEGRLDGAESDRVVRFARLAGRARKVLEGESDARNWLTSPQHGLGGATPLDFAATEAGAREVEDLLGRIEYGVYS